MPINASNTIEQWRLAFNNLDSDVNTITAFAGVGTSLDTTATDLAGAINEHEARLDSDNSKTNTNTVDIATNASNISTNTSNITDIYANFLRNDSAFTKTSGDVIFNDNVKAIFGTGSDLQIYHDGSHSYITDPGTGNLKILSSQIDLLGGADGAETMATFVDDGAVTIYYDNVAKLATTSAGVNITGDLSITGTYTGDSSIPTAAIQAGAITSAKLFDVQQIDILDSTGTVVRSLYGAGA
jgi:hypothetical protein